MNEEQQRYRAIQAQIESLLDATAKDTSPYGVANIGRTLLAAHMHALNEASHLHYQEARIGLLTVLKQRIQLLSDGDPGHV